MISGNFSYKYEHLWCKPESRACRSSDTDPRPGLNEKTLADFGIAASYAGVQNLAKLHLL